MLIILLILISKYSTIRMVNAQIEEFAISEVIATDTGTTISKTPTFSNTPTVLPTVTALTISVTPTSENTPTALSLITAITQTTPLPNLDSLSTQSTQIDIDPINNPPEGQPNEITMKDQYRSVVTVALTDINIGTKIEVTLTPNPAETPNDYNEVQNNQWMIKLQTEKVTDFQNEVIMFSEHVSTIIKLDTIIVSVSKDNESFFLDFIEKAEGIVYIESDNVIEGFEIIPNDPEFQNQTYFGNINALKGWAFSTGSDSNVIAILDTGVDLYHPDLIGKIIPGYDFVNSDDIAQDDNGHGTRVAGVAAASSNNGIGITGVNWGAKILPVKVLDFNGLGSYSKLSEGIVWAVDQGADVINLSLGGVNFSQTLKEAVDYAIKNNVVVVASSGNNGGAVLYPASYTEVLAVSATDALNHHASFSNFGSSIDVCAPGVNIFSTSINGGYSNLSGTSFSAPQVSGLASILLGIKHFNSVQELTNVITETTLDLGLEGWDPLFGWGLIQMDNAIISIFPVSTDLPNTDPGLEANATEAVESTVAPQGKESNEFATSKFPATKMPIIQETIPSQKIDFYTIDDNCYEPVIEVPTSNPFHDVSITDNSADTNFEKDDIQTESLPSSKSGVVIVILIFSLSVFNWLMFKQKK